VRLVLAEDEALLRRGLRVLLESDRRVEVVAEAADGLELLSAITAHRPDVVLVDVQMPGMDGLTATRLLRTMPEAAGLVIVAMTAHALVGDRERCLDAGMDDYLSKPLAPEALRRCLERWLQPSPAA
jgi:CheY-like chemotaxis protein